MKSRIAHFLIHPKNFPLAPAMGLTIAAFVGCASWGADTPQPGVSATPEKLQDQLDEQTKRIDRLYRALGPVLEELEQEAARVEKAQQEEKQRAFDRAVEEAAQQGNYADVLRLLADQLQTEQSQLGATHAQTLRSLRRLTDFSGCLGDWAGCVKGSQKLMELSGYDHLVARGCAVAGLLDGEERIYRDVCARMMAESAATQDPLIADRTAKTCLLKADSVPDLKPVLQLADAAVKAQPDSPWFKLVKGMAEYRADHAEETLRWLDELRAHQDPHIACLSGLLAAMSQHRLGHGEQAKAALAQASARLDAFLQQGNLAGGSWERWWFDAAASVVLRAEAEKLILGSEVSPRPTTTSLAAARKAWWTLHVKLGCDFPAQLLQPDAWKASWSPDSQRIAFGKQGGGIAVLDLQTHITTDLTSKGQDPAWSPDGKFIAYVTVGGKAYVSEEIWVLPAAGGEPVRIGKGGFPSWSADSAQVLFHSRERNQILSVRVATPDEPPVVSFEKPLSWYPSISPDGSRMAFGAGEKLTVLDRETGQTVASLPTPGERGLLAGWSPDGRQVAFGGFAGSRAGLWVFDVERGGAFQVAKNPGCTMPAWSPDGKSLAFDLRGNTNEIWLVKTESLPREPALTNQLPSLSPQAVASETRETSLEGKPVPGPFKLALLDGGEFVLPATGSTNIVLLDFWATWCGPCRQVMPTLAEISREYAPRGVRYVAVNLREKPETIRAYLTSTKLDLTVALDTDGKMAEAFHVRGIPTMVLVDPANVVRKVHVGASPEVGKELRRALDDLLRNAPAQSPPNVPKQ